MNRTRQIANLFCALLIFFSADATRGEERKDPIDGISDNSFLIEEAYNQEQGEVQHVFNAVFTNESRRRGWSFNFTQEWWLFSDRHQISYSIPFYRLREEGEGQRGVGDILLEYRYQLTDEGPKIPAVAPKFSLILPTGDRNKGTGDGVVGYQWNLPFSKKFPPRFAMHANFGLTYLPKVRAPLDGGGLSPRRSLVSYNLGASAIFALTSRFHAMLEWVGNFEESLNGNGRRAHDFVSMISPGIRASVIEKEGLQTVIGVALPIGLTKPADKFDVLLYLSIEHKLF